MLFGGEEFTTIDIGSYSIKVARFRKKKSELTLLATGMRKLPFATINEGKIVDPSIITSKLEEIFNELNYHPSKIITTIPSNNLIIRNIELPLMSENELAEAIKWEAEDYLPFPVNLASLDYIILSQNEGMMNILLVAVKEEIIENFLSPFERLALKPAVINVQPMALLSLLEYQGKITEPLAIIDIGASGTRVIIGDNNNIFLSRNIDTGGEDFTRLLMEEMQMEYQQAEDYKIEYGIRKERKEEKNVELDLSLSQLTLMTMGRRDSLLPIARNLAGEISRSLDYYSMKYRGKSINQVYLTGGGSRLKKLGDVISHEINLELKSLNPFEGFQQSFDRRDMADEFAVAIGLAVSEVVADES